MLDLYCRVPLSTVQPYHELRVTVGSDPCTSIQVSPANITCIPPEAPEGLRHGKARVQASVVNFIIILCV